MRDKDLLGKPKKNSKKALRQAQRNLESEINSTASTLSQKRAKLKAINKADKITKGSSGLVTDTDLTLLPPSGVEALASVETLWVPDYDPDLSMEENLKRVAESPGIQARFLSSSEDEVLYTGGRGSGKSDCLLVDPLPQCNNKNFRGLLIRNTMKELRELIKRAKQLYPLVYKGVEWKSQESLFIFPSGATIEFGYCDKEEDIDNYKGQQYTWIGVDELSKFPWPDFVDQLKGSLRTTDPNLKCYFRAATNADGRGKFWIKKRWIDKAKSEERIVTKYMTPIGEVEVTSKWFHSTPFDNKVLLKTGATYIANLFNIDDPVRREQWINNNWEVSSDTAFPEFNQEVHVVEPFKIPSNWYKICGCDYGFSSMAVALWAAVSPDGKMYIYRELKATGLTADLLQKSISEADSGEFIQKEVLDGSAWASRGEVGETPGDTMLRLGGRWVPADRSKGSRKAGKQLLHQLLNKDIDSGKPGIFIFNTCQELISELKTLQPDQNDPEDVDTSKKSTLPDHAYDALRYILLARPPVNHNRFWHTGFNTNRTVDVTPVSTRFGY